MICDNYFISYALKKIPVDKNSFLKMKNRQITNFHASSAIQQSAVKLFKKIHPWFLCQNYNLQNFCFYKIYYFYKIMNFYKLNPFSIAKRSISTSSVDYGKRNFRKFMLYNKRGTILYKKARAQTQEPDIPIDKRGVRDTGFILDGKYVEVPERIPELIVPNMEDCKFKPYVSYKTADIVQSEFTSQDLFNSVYAQKIIDDFKNNKLIEDGSPLEASAEEKLDANEAWIRARKTGSDIF